MATLSTATITLPEPEIELIYKCPDGNELGSLRTGDVITLIVPNMGIKFFNKYDEAVAFFYNQVKDKNYEYISVAIKQKNN